MASVLLLSFSLVNLSFSTWSISNFNPWSNKHPIIVYIFYTIILKPTFFQYYLKVESLLSIFLDERCVIVFYFLIFSFSSSKTLIFIFLCYFNVLYVLMHSTLFIYVPQLSFNHNHNPVFACSVCVWLCVSVYFCVCVFVYIVYMCIHVFVWVHLPMKWAYGSKMLTLGVFIHCYLFFFEQSLPGWLDWLTN